MLSRKHTKYILKYVNAAKCGTHFLLHIDLFHLDWKSRNTNIILRQHTLAEKSPYEEIIITKSKQHVF